MAVRVGLNATSELYFQKIRNVAWVSAFFGILSSVIVAIFFLSFPTAENLGQSEVYFYTIALYFLACIIESIAEPFFLLAYSSLYIELRVRAEGTSFFIRGIVQFGAIAWSNLGVLSFGLAQLAYALSLFMVYFFFFFSKIHSPDDVKKLPIKSMVDFLPRFVSENRSALDKKENKFALLRRIFPESSFDPYLLSLSFSFLSQSAVKYALSEGDKLMMVFLSTSAYDMGVYGIVFHIGSLVPRLLFLPVEEMSRALFSKLYSSIQPLENDKSISLKDLKRKNFQIYADLYKYVTMVIKLMLCIGVVFTCFGLNYTRSLVFLLLGKEKMLSYDGLIPYLLSWYCFYIGFLAVNGVCEAFVYATAENETLLQLNIFSCVCFVVYAMSTLFFVSYLQFGTVGLILASCVNMSCRILYCTHYLKLFFQGSVNSTNWIVKFVRKISISFPVTLWLICTIIFTNYSGVFFLGRKGTSSLLLLNHFYHIIIGGICFIVSLGCFFVFEKSFLQDLAQFRRSKSPKKD